MATEDSTDEVPARIAASEEADGVDEDEGGEGEDGEHAKRMHMPPKKATSALRLEISRVLHDDGTPVWKDMREASRAVGRAAQQAVGEIQMHVARCRGAGRSRMPTPSERAFAKENDLPLPVECLAKDDILEINRIFTRVMRGTGLTEYIYGSIAQRIKTTENRKTHLL